MLTDFPDYRENRKIVMQLIECYQVKEDIPRLLACFELLFMRFQTHTLGIYKAIRYYSQHGHIDKIDSAWLHCRINCSESGLFREIEKLVQPYLSNSKADPVASESIPIEDHVLDPDMITRLELEDVFEDLDINLELQSEEQELRKLTKKNPRYIPDLLNRTQNHACSDLIKSLDLAIPRKLKMFDDKRSTAIRTNTQESLSTLGTKHTNDKCSHVNESPFR